MNNKGKTGWGIFLLLFVSAIVVLIILNSTPDASSPSSATEIIPEENVASEIVESTPVPIDTEPVEVSKTEDPSAETPEQNQSEPQKRRIVYSGRVLDQNNEPVANAEVSVFHYNPPPDFQNTVRDGVSYSKQIIETSETDNEGNYNLVSDYESTQYVQASYNSLRSDKEKVTPYNDVENFTSSRYGEHPYQIDFVIHQTSTLEVTVKDSSEQPITEASVDIRSEIEEQSFKLFAPISHDNIIDNSTTDENGIAKLYHHSNHEIMRLSVYARGYERYSEDIHQSYKQIDVTLEKSNTLFSGRVVDRHTQEPLLRRNVVLSMIGEKNEKLGHFSTLTDKDGSFEFVDIPAGKYEIHANNGMNFSDQKRYRHRMYKELLENPLENGDKRTGFLIELDTGEKLEYLFVDHLTDEPIPGVKITGNSGRDRTQITNEFGTATFSKGQYDTFSIDILSPEYNFVDFVDEPGYDVPVPPDHSSLGSGYDIYTFLPEKDSRDYSFKVRLKKIKSISGIVVDQSNQPVSSISVGVRGDTIPSGSGFRTRTDQEVVTNFDGTFSIFVPDSLLGYVYARQNNLLHASDFFTIMSETDYEREVRIKLGRTREVFGKTLDQNGNPIAGIEVRSYCRDRINSSQLPNRQSTTSDEDGNFYFENTFVENLYLESDSDEYQDPEKIILAHTDGTKENPIILTYTKNEKVSGYVYDPNGNPLEGVYVRLTYTNESNHSIGTMNDTDENGYFEIRDLKLPAELSISSGETDDGLLYKRYTMDVTEENQNSISITLEERGRIDYLISIKDKETKEIIPDAVALFTNNPELLSLGEIPAVDGIVLLEDMPRDSAFTMTLNAKGYPENPSVSTRIPRQPDEEADLVEYEAYMTKGKTYRGIVLDPETDQGVPNVEIRYRLLHSFASSACDPEDYHVIYSDSTGRFTISNAVGDINQIMTEPIDEYFQTNFDIYEFRNSNRTRNGDTDKLIEIYLDKGKNLEVKIVSDRNGTPLEGVELTFTIRSGNNPFPMNGVDESSVKTLTTDENGIVRLENLPSKTIPITSDLFPQRKLINLSEYDEYEVAVTIPVGTHTLEIEVLEAGEPVPSEQLTIGKSSSKIPHIGYLIVTDSTGKCKITNLPLDGIQYNISNREYRELKDWFSLDENSDTTKVVVEIPTGQVTGTLTDPYGSPISDAQIQLRTKELNPEYGIADYRLASRKASATDQNGDYELSLGSTLGELYVYSEIDSFPFPAIQSIMIEDPDQEYEADLSFKSGENNLQVSFYDAQSNEQIQEAGFSLNTLDEWSLMSKASYINENDKAILENIPDGTYMVNSFSSGYKLERNKLTITGGGLHELDAILEPFAQISIKLVDSRGVSIKENYRYNFRPVNSNNPDYILEGELNKSLIQFTDLLVEPYEYTISGETFSVLGTIEFDESRIHEETLVVK